MSSATSIDRMKADRVAAAEARAEGRGNSRDTFRPWHFFVLASLLAATAAVVLARQSRPEHLVLISLTIGAAGFAAAALYRTLLPLVTKDPGAITERRLTESMRAVLEREKTLVLRSIKELEFDRAMGKVSAHDFDEMAGRLRNRALSLMRQLDREGEAYRELIERELSARMHRVPASRKPAAERRPAAGAVPEHAARVQPPDGPPGAGSAEAASSREKECVCGAMNDPDAVFCKRCGTRLEGSAAS